MKWIRNFITILVLMVLVGACLKQPEYSIIPEISFNDLYFKPGNPTNGIPDSLIVKFDFKDGDGDLGIGAQDSTSLDFFSPWYYLYDIKTFQIYYTNDRLSALPNGYKWVTYASRNISQLSSLNLPAINCANWEQISGNAGVTDTLYITQNLKAYNINFDIYTRDLNGNYVLYDPEQVFAFPNCSPNIFRGTFKDLASDRGKKSPIEGTFKYTYQSSLLNSQFSGKTMRLVVSIQDRAFHKSNEIEKKDFSLSSITK